VVSDYCAVIASAARKALAQGRRATEISTHARYSSRVYAWGQAFLAALAITAQ